MQKITRKSSSGKFSLPAFARGKSRLESATSSPAQGHPPAEDEEDAMEASVGSLSGLGLKGTSAGAGAGAEQERGSKDGGSRSGRSWSSVLKLGRKEKKGAGGDTTPSLSGSGMSVASETDEGADEEEDEDGDDGARTEGEEDERERK